MKVFATLLGALALLAGFVGGMRAYSVAADAGPPPVTPVSAPHHPQAQVVRPGIVFRWAPCKPPAHREGKACVTHVTHVVPLASPAAAAPAAPAPATSAPVVHRPSTPHVTRPKPSPSPSQEPSTPEPSDGGGDDGGGPEPGDH
jgi:hypothetical protein